ncbi:MAG: hypothetical protein FJ398_22145 [Verrucomicrobia bacterium]|nr:hypothetical protein [Verrucomicrobiota bacterium]
MPPAEAVVAKAAGPAAVARQALRSLDEVVWATDPQLDTLEHLVDYVGRSAREYLQGANVTLRLDVPVEIPDESLRAGARHNIVLAINKLPTEDYLRLAEWFERRRAEEIREASEDRQDLEDAKVSLAEPGENIPWEQIKTEMGLK